MIIGIPVFFKLDKFIEDVKGAPLAFILLPFVWAGIAFFLYAIVSVAIQGYWSPPNNTAIVVFVLFALIALTFPYFSIKDEVSTIN